MGREEKGLTCTEANRRRMRVRGAENCRYGMIWLECKGGVLFVYSSTKRLPERSPAYS